MLIEIILFLVLGILAGTFTGLFPGIHINLISSLVVSVFSSLVYLFQPIYLIVFITSMAITHTFLDFIPAILLGCPSEDTSLSILPGHELLKSGNAYEAIRLTSYGCLISILFLLVILPILLIAIPPAYNFIKTFIPYILILVILVLIFTEKNKFSALIVVILTGILGFAVLNLNLKEPLLPLLSGLFGASSLVISLKEKTKIPKQEIQEPAITSIKPFLGALISSPLCGFLPGLGSAQAATLGNTIVKTDRKGFLVLLGATNLLVMAFSFISLFTIFKGRTGVAVAIQEIVGILSEKELFLIILTIVLSGIISFFLTKSISKCLIKIVNKINYSKISIATLIILAIVILYFSGVFGFLIFILSTLTGIYCISLNVRRTLMMACLIIPTILIYLV